MAAQPSSSVLEAHAHRAPLDADQLRTLANALATLKRLLGDQAALNTPVYSSILRMLKAHVIPLQNTSVSFAQVQAVRLQTYADQLLVAGKTFPAALANAVSQGLVAGYDPATGLRIPPERQRQILEQQKLNDRYRLLEHRRLLEARQLDFKKTRDACVAAFKARQHVEPLPDPDLFIPWEQRALHVRGPASPPSQPSAASSASTATVAAHKIFPSVDTDTLARERTRFLSQRTSTVVTDITAMLDAHREGVNSLEPREAALLETRVRHANLLALQTRLRNTVREEHLLVERDTRHRVKGRARTIKQLQREYERAERARVRQLEAEERDARRKRQAWINAIQEHINKFRSFHRDVVRRGMRAVTKSVQKYHEDVAKSVSRAEREAERARIQKLKDDDEEGYLELVRQTKNTRLLELLNQTDKYLRELGAVVKEERAKSGVVEYENGREKPGQRVSYYEIAHAIKEDVHEQSTLLVGGKLKEYQLTGIQWMVSLYNNRLNGILADEMGLGKTIQTLGLIAHLMERKDNPGPYLVIVPLSTISNWELEFARWTPAIRVVVFKGDAKTRKRLYEEVIEKKSFNVCLVTYEYVVRGKNLLKRVEWQHLVIDEGHRIKNHESRLSSVLHGHYRSRNRLLLTGTPLQNSLTELWALLNFLLPTVFKSAESFESWFAAPFANMGVGSNSSTEQQSQLSEEESLLIIRRLHQVLRPFLLRRLKSDVLRMGEQLPQKQEHILLCEMSAWQRYMYLRIVKSERVLFTDRHGRQRYDTLSNPAIQLRKCVNHPYLFYTDHASRIIDTPQLWRASGKFDMLDSIITKFLRTGHRLLIFNQMTKVVDLQARLLNYRNIPFYRLDGTTGTDERKQMVNDFNSEGSKVNVFLLTTRAGGLGVNLQTADTVIIFDSDWNPSMDQQAQDRAHRIGQRREVLVLRMITNKSIEEDVMERASFKRGLEKKIIRAGMFDEQSKDSERQAMLRELLRVEGPGSDDDHPDDGLLSDEEVNRILARSEEEFEIFSEIDEERKAEIGPFQRLMSEKEIPEWSTKVPKALLLKAKTSGAGNWSTLDTSDLSILNEPKKKRAAATNVSYAVDQLSESQYINLMERSEAGEDVSLSDAIRSVSGKKRRRKERSTDKEDREEDEPLAKRGSSSGKNKRTHASGDVAGPANARAETGGSNKNAHERSADDDLTDGGNVTGGEQSAIPSGGEDVVIEEDDEDDDEDAVIDDKANGSKSDDSPDVQSMPSEDDADSPPPPLYNARNSSSTRGTQPRRGRRGRPPLRGRPRGRERSSREPARVLEDGPVKPTLQSTSEHKTGHASGSDSSPSPIRRPASRKRPRSNPTNLRSAPVSSRKDGDSDTNGTSTVEHPERESPKAPEGSPTPKKRKPSPDIDASTTPKKRNSSPDIRIPRIPKTSERPSQSSEVKQPGTSLGLTSVPPPPRTALPHLTPLPQSHPVKADNPSSKRLTPKLINSRSENKTQNEKATTVKNSLSSVTKPTPSSSKPGVPLSKPVIKSPEPTQSTPKTSTPTTSKSIPKVVLRAEVVTHPKLKSAPAPQLPKPAKASKAKSSMIEKDSPNLQKTPAKSKAYSTSGDTPGKEEESEDGEIREDGELSDEEPAPLNSAKKESSAKETQRPASTPVPATSSAPPTPPPPRTSRKPKLTSTPPRPKVTPPGGSIGRPAVPTRSTPPRPHAPNPSPNPNAGPILNLPRLHRPPNNSPSPHLAGMNNRSHPSPPHNSTTSPPGPATKGSQGPPTPGMPQGIGQPPFMGYGVRGGPGYPHRGGMFGPQGRTPHGRHSVANFRPPYGRPPMPGMPPNRMANPINLPNFPTIHPPAIHAMPGAPLAPGTTITPGVSIAPGVPTPSVSAAMARAAALHSNMAMNGRAGPPGMGRQSGMGPGMPTPGPMPPGMSPQPQAPPRPPPSHAPHATQSAPMCPPSHTPKPVPSPMSSSGGVSEVRTKGPIHPVPRPPSSHGTPGSSVSGGSRSSGSDATGAHSNTNRMPPNTKSVSGAMKNVVVDASPVRGAPTIQREPGRKKAVITPPAPPKPHSKTASSGQALNSTNKAANVVSDGEEGEIEEEEGEIIEES